MVFGGGGGGGGGESIALPQAIDDCAHHIAQIYMHLR